MRYKGTKPPAPRSQDITFPREEGNIVFVLDPVLNYEERFTKLFPEPKPPVTTTFDDGASVQTKDYEDEKYLASLNKRNELLPMWLIYESIKNNEDVEFERVREDDHETWTHIQEELLEFLVMGEMTLLIEEVQKVNLPNKFIIEDTVKAFAQARQKKESDRSSQNTEHSGTESGELVSG